jgi:hypothetical protein
MHLVGEPLARFRVSMPSGADLIAQAGLAMRTPFCPAIYINISPFASGL